MFAHGLVRFEKPRHDQFEHDVVGEKNVRRIFGDPFAFLVRFLSRVASERNRFPVFSIAEAQIPLQFLALAVAERVHRVRDDGRDALAGMSFALLSQHMVDNGNEVGERLAGPRAGRQHVRLAPVGYFDCVGLVPVQTDGFAGRVVRPLDSEYFRAFRFQRARMDEVVHVSARLEIGIQLDERGGPELPAGVGFVDRSGYIFGPDGGEAAGKSLVLCDKFFTKCEYVHLFAYYR